MRYLSSEWFAAAQAAVDNDIRLRELTAELDLVVEQTVDGGPEESGPSSRPGAGKPGKPNGDTDRPNGEPGAPIRWHLVFDHGAVRLVVGPAEQADLRFRAPYPVAQAIAQGEMAAAQAFIRGELTVGGDLRLLTTHQRVFAAVGDVLGTQGPSGPVSAPAPCPVPEDRRSQHAGDA